MVVGRALEIEELTNAPAAALELPDGTVVTGKTTPLLGAGLKADNIVVKLPDDSILFSADNFKTRVALPSLFVLTAKVSCLEINNPFVNLEIADEQFKVMQLVEDKKRLEELEILHISIV